MTISAARRLIEETPVWDHHACLPLRSSDASFLPQLARHKAAGFDAVTVNVGFGEHGPEDHLRILAAFRHWLMEHSDDYLLLIRPKDVALARSTNRLAVGFDIEGANAIGDQISLIQLYYDLGVRWMLMAYNLPNRVGGGCQANDEGLTPFGRRVLAEMERVGMQVCVSHTGHRTVRDVFEAATRPVIFSHSNCAALYPHPRNIPDDLIQACAASGGLVGINGVGIFLGPSDVTSQTYARHVDHVVQLVGPQHVSIALDYVFDVSELEAYVESMKATFPKGLGYELRPGFIPPEQLEDIVSTLQGWGYRDEDLKALLGGNLIRLAQTVWKEPGHV